MPKFKRMQHRPARRTAWRVDQLIERIKHRPLTDAHIETAFSGLASIGASLEDAMQKIRLGMQNLYDMRGARVFIGGVEIGRVVG
jgi:hypothetical protein